MEFSDASETKVVATSPTSPPPPLSPTSSSSPLSLNSNCIRNSGNSVRAATNASPVVISPCAACKILRRRCADKCILAPYFPPTEPSKFTIAHRVFGASNIIKLLQDLPEWQRADAVSSMVYEARARTRDPVYGCAGTICQLQKRVSDLQGQLAKSQADLLIARTQQGNLMALLCVGMADHPPTTPSQLLDDSFISGLQQDEFFPSNTTGGGLSFLDDAGLATGGSYWEPLRT